MSRRARSWAWPWAGPLVAQQRRVALRGDLAEVFAGAFAVPGRCVWLDSGVRGAGSGRVSYLGAASEVAGARVLAWPGRVCVEAGGCTTEVGGGVLDVLRAGLARARVTGPAGAVPWAGGFVGALAFEAGLPRPRRASTPLGAWLHCDRLAAFDHDSGELTVVALAPLGEQEAARAWVDHAAGLAGRVRRVGRPVAAAPDARDARVRRLVEAGLRRGRERYLADIGTAMRALREGRSFQVCVTDTVEVPAPGDPWAFYRRLRAASPAPYAAYLQVGAVTVASASPERFLAVDADGWVETRPIKGTAARGATVEEDARARAGLADCAKTRAENLIVVDLLRNDLSRVCRPGSVEVPGLLEVETYASVHQLVSTVRGRLEPGRDALHAVAACFPGGSMTGAPKPETLRIIDAVEGAPRGLYSGLLGWFAPDGSADTSIVIRTAVLQGGVMSVGAGGAIVLDSDPAAEYDEMLLKAGSVVAAHPLL